MKKLCFLVFAVFILSVSRMQAQGFHLGIKAGTNMSQITGRSFDQGFQWGFSAGAFAELNFTSKWGIQPEFFSIKPRHKQPVISMKFIMRALIARNVSLNYLSIPILFLIKFIPVLSIQVGPQFGILMNTSQNITSNASNAFKSQVIFQW